MPDYQPSEKYRLAILLTITGGFLESYSYVTRNGVFANAQTGNIARLGMALARADFPSVIRYSVPVVAFVAGVTLSMRIRHWAGKRDFYRFHWRQFIVFLEILLLSVIGFISQEANDIFVTVTISFVCALQGESFRKFYGNAFASTMCTGNLRSATENLNHYFDTKKRTFGQKSLLYFGIDLTFVAGAFLGYHTTQALGTRAVWMTLFLMVAVFFMMFAGNEECANTLTENASESNI